MIEGAPSPVPEPVCWVERGATPPAQAATLPSDPPRQAAMRDAAAIRRWIKASSTASAQMKRGTSGGFELALGAQPVATSSKLPCSRWMKHARSAISS